MVLIGIDGATWNAIHPMMERGLLPSISKMIKEGVHGPLESTQPPLSPAAWTSIFTGVGPGRHGIFGFTKRKPDSYFITPISSRDRVATPIWRMVSREGLSTVALNIPFAYPPDRVTGVMTTGLGTPSKGSEFTYPMEFKHELLDKYPGFDVDFNEDMILLGREADPVKKIFEVTQEQIRVTKDLFDGRKWDLFISVLRSTDVIQHFYWNDQAVMDECYSQVDGLVGWMMDHLDEKTLLMVCSDHGFDAVHHRVNITRWLNETGFLKLKERRSKGTLRRTMPSAEKVQSTMIRMGLKGTVNRLKRSGMAEGAMKHVFTSDRFDYINAIEWGKTRAYFRIGTYGNIYLNKAGREPEGCVEPEEEEELLRSIGKAALEMKDPDSGEKVIAKTLLGSQLFGDHSSERPDLVLLTNHGYRLVAGGDGTGALFEREDKKVADHTQYGVVIVYGKDAKRGATIEGAGVTDIVPTILRWLGVEHRGTLEGTALECTEWKGQGE
jgi:predicted AlkP superfamily phosphohydrolase/phosphomutase